MALNKIFKRTLIKYNSIPIAAKAGLWFTICFVIQRGIQFIGMPIFTRLMSQTDYGVYSTFTSWAHILVIASSLNIYSGIFNKAMIKYKDRTDQYISSIQTLTTFTSAFVAIIFVVFNSQLSELLNLSSNCIYLMGAYIMTFPPFQYWSQRMRFSFRYRPIIVMTLTVSISNLLVSIIFVMNSDTDKGLALIKATVIIQTITSIIFYIYTFLKGKCLFNFEFWKWSLLLAIPLLPHFFSEILLGHADRIMINSMCGSDKAAIYNIAYQISMVMTIIRTGINSAYLAWEYKAIDANNYDSVKRTTNYYSILMWVMTIVCMLIGPELLSIVAPSSYNEALYDIPAIMAGCFYIFEYVLFLNIEIYYEKKQYVVIASIVTAILNVVLNYFCIQQWGYLAAGYTTAVSYAVMVLMHYFFFLRIMKDNVEVRNIYNVKLLLFLMIMTVVMMIGVLFLYTNVILRWSFIIIIVLFGFIKRKSIVNLIKTIKAK